MAENNLNWKDLLPSQDWGDYSRRKQLREIVQQLNRQGVSIVYECSSSSLYTGCYWRLRKDGKEGGLTWHNYDGNEQFSVTVFELLDENGEKLPEFDFVNFSLFCAW